MKKLGVIGGLGSKATAYFFNRLVDLTDAKTDQEHIELIIHNHPQIPDRTAYILGESSEDPMPYLLEDTKQLIQMGCDAIYVPCNTAHYFMNQFDEDLKSHIVHMIDETVHVIKEKEQTRVLLLATSGTVKTGLYQDAFLQAGIECEVLPDQLQSELMALIYNVIKAGKQATIDMFLPFSIYAHEQGVESIILGCTELSVLKETLQLSSFCVDAMECAIKACILQCGKQVKAL